MYDDDGRTKTRRPRKIRLTVSGARRLAIAPTRCSLTRTSSTPLSIQDTEQKREVVENTPAGRNLGPRVAATDPGDVLTYSLTGDGCGVV